jgi:hypothetical protein
LVLKKVLDRVSSQGVQPPPPAAVLYRIMVKSTVPPMRSVPLPIGKLTPPAPMD